MMRCCSDLIRHSVNIRRFLSTVPLTADVHKEITKLKFNQVNDVDLKYFEGILGKTRILTNPDDVETYNVDWMRAYRGQSKVVLKPKTVEEVSAVLRHCNERLLAVVPQGGNTGLVGGSVPVFDEVIISMSLMNQIYKIDSTSGFVVTQAGVVLEKLESEVNKHGLSIPLDLGAKGSCQIGGNVSTNAGGIRLLRYGSLHGNVLGLKAVLPDGEILDCLTSLRKDNTGYDLKQLFIGAEGTLGIITDVSIFCAPKPVSINVAYFGCSTFDDAVRTFAIAKSKLGEILSAFELLDKASVDCVTKNLGLKSPLETEHNFYILVETAGSNESHDQEKLNEFLNNVLETGCIHDGIVAQDSSQTKRIWDVREHIAIAFNKLPFWYMDDVSMTLETMSKLVEKLHHLPPDWPKLSICLSYFGHMGDGNLHLNIVAPRYVPEIAQKLEMFVYPWLKDHKGSISAEHGLGLKKAKYLQYSKGNEAIKYMKKIKTLFDPNGIMNPYKYLPNIS